MPDKGASQLVGDALVTLAKPIIELRELVETFRSHRIVVDGSEDTMRGAAAALAAFERRRPDELPTLARLVTELDVLLEVGWSVDMQMFDTLSIEIAELLPVVVPTCIPQPDDEQNWAFTST